MSVASEKKSVAIVSACMDASGFPTFAMNEVSVTQEEMDNGVHYDLAEVMLREAGYDEPYVHFDATEAPTFLHPAVRQHLGLAPVADDCPTPVIVEEPA